MQPPTFAEFEAFRKVSTWINSQAMKFASAPAPELAKGEPIPSPKGRRLPALESPLDIFQRFPDGASLRDLQGASRAFRRFAAQVVSDCACRAQRKAAWAKVGVDLVVRDGRVILRLARPSVDVCSPDPQARHAAELARDGAWFASQVSRSTWEEVAHEIAEAERLSLRDLVRHHPEWSGTDILAAIEFSPNYLPKPLADLGITISGNVYRIDF